MGSELNQDSPYFLSVYGVPNQCLDAYFDLQIPTINGAEVLAPHPGIVSWLDQSSGRIADKGSPMCSIEFYKHKTIMQSHIMGFCKRLVTEGAIVQKGDPLFRINW